MAHSKPPAAGASKLGRYELVKELSGSGVATTWLARVTTDDKPELFTVLRLHKHVAKSAEVAEEFISAGRAAHKLDHAGIVPIVDTGVTDGEVFTVSPHGEGDSLANLTRNAGTIGLPQPVVLRILLDVLEAVEAAHTMDPPMVHGELNPWTIHVGTNGRARVSGFGIARALAKIGLHGIKNHDRLAYAAPERVKVMASTHAPGDESVAPPSDLFSLGVVAWECYTRQRLFSSRMEAAIIQKVLTAPIGPPTGTGVELPADVEEGIMKALEREPSQRIANAGDFIMSLEGAGPDHIAKHEEVAEQLEKFCGRALANRKRELEAALSNERKASIRPTAPRGARSLLHMAMAKPIDVSLLGGAQGKVPSDANDKSAASSDKDKDDPAKPKPRKRRPARRIATLLGVAAPLDDDGAADKPAKTAPAPLDETAPDQPSGGAKGVAPKPSAIDEPEELFITMDTYDGDDGGPGDVPIAEAAKQDKPAAKKAPPPPAPPPPPRATSRAKPPAPPRKAGAKPAPPKPATPAATPAAKPGRGRSTTPTAGTPVAAAKAGASGAKDFGDTTEVIARPKHVIVDEPTEVDDHTDVVTRSKVEPRTELVSRTEVEPLKTPPSDSGDDVPRTGERGKAGASVERIGPGKSLGKYEIIAPVARGGMASVWLGRIKGSKDFSQLVAVKTMLPDVSDDPDFEKMFLDESRVAAKIRHKNVVEIFDLAEQEHVLYLAMEYVDGETVGQLQRSAKDLGGIPANIVAHIGAQGCAGLHAAHELRDDSDNLLELVHRDISPGNILLTADGIVKIVDFGIAKSKGRLHVTRVGSTVKGKTPYLSPEQLGGLAIDRRSDLFSFGALLYVLVTGLHPFRGSSELQTIENIALKDPVLPRELSPDCPEGLQDIIMKALTKDSKKRFASAEEMGKALEDELAKMPTTEADVAAFMRKALGETLDRRDRNVRAAIAKLDSRARAGTAPAAVAASAPAAPGAKPADAASAGAPPASAPAAPFPPGTPPTETPVAFPAGAADGAAAASAKPADVSAPMFPPPNSAPEVSPDESATEPMFPKSADPEGIAPTEPMFANATGALVTEDTPSAAERDVGDDDRFDKTSSGKPDPRRRRVLQMAVTGMVVGLGILGLVAIFGEESPPAPTPTPAASLKTTPTPVATPEPTPEPPPVATEDPEDELDAGTDEEDAGEEDAGEEAEEDAGEETTKKKPVVKRPRRPWKPPPKKPKKYDPTGI